MTGGVFNASRLRLARRCRGFTKKALAERVKLDVRSVSGYENEEFRPELASLTAIAAELSFPIEFFYGEELEEPAVESASFRSMARMSASQRDMALGNGTLALALNDWIEKRFELPALDLPDLSRGGHPEGAADMLRHHWGLGESPVKNMIHLLESKGIRVFSLTLNAVEVDAFSIWRNGRPFVFLNTKKSTEHSRFDAAHELGHIVLHRHGAPRGPDAEREANAFASAFLMPKASIIHQGRGLLLATVDTLIKLKKHWIVSVAALAYRLHALGLLSEWHVRSLFIEITKRGYRKKEPEEAPREKSLLLEKIFKALETDRVTSSQIAAQLHISSKQFNDLIFGLAPDTGLAQTNSRPHLRLVKSSE